jgi:hypothetical protein
MGDLVRLRCIPNGSQRCLVKEVAVTDIAGSFLIDASAWGVLTLASRGPASPKLRGDFATSDPSRLDKPHRSDPGQRVTDEQASRRAQACTDRDVRNSA